MSRPLLAVGFVLYVLGFLGCEAGNGGPAMTAPTAVTDSSGHVPAGYELVWNDEFDYTGLPDSNRWGYQVGGHGWTAKEMQMYTKADPTNVNVADGKLSLTLRPNPEAGARNPFTSARLVTNDKAQFERGYFEFRAKFPAGQGLRSALWMVGDTVSTLGWPEAGEIDVIEHYGSIPDVVTAAVQTPALYWSKKGQIGKSVKVPTATTDFHVYGLEWTADQLTVAVDGTPFYAYNRRNDASGYTWPFDWPFYLALNVSAGGIRGAAKNGVARDLGPSTLEVDYVRVYQR